MALLQSLLIGLLALIITPGYLFYFDVTPKIVVLLTGAGLTLFGCTISGTVWRNGTTHRLFALLLVLNALSLTISTALSQHPALSAFGTNWRRFGSVIYAAVMLFAWLVASHTAGRPGRIRIILRGIALAGGISAIYGIAQYFGWDPILPSAGYHIGEGIWSIVRPPGTFGYVSYFATWLLFAGFLSMALATMESSALWQRIAYSAAVLSTVAMIFTGTRAAILGLIGGIVAKLYFARRASPSTARAPRAWRRPLTIAVLTLAAGAAFYSSPPGQNLRSRTHWIAEDRWGGNRLVLWRDTLGMAVPRLLQGYGPEVFTAAFPAFESKALAQAYPDFLHESPHNIFLDALISQGLPGLIILFALCFVGLRPAWLASRTANAAAPWIAAALLAGIVSQQFTVFTMPTAFFFYITIALAIALAADPAEPRRDWRFTLAAAPVTLALLYLALRLTVSDHALVRTQRSVDLGDQHMAELNYSRYLHWTLPGTTADLWYSRALLTMAQKTPDYGARYRAIAQSGAAADRATVTAEDPFNAWYNRATLYASQNDFEHTEKSLRAAVAANPNWFKPHWTLAQMLRLERRFGEAEREAALAADLDAGKHPEVARTLFEIRSQLSSSARP